MQRRDVGPKTAETLLRQACGSAAVRTLCLITRGICSEKLLVLRTLPPELWDHSILNRAKSSIGNFDYNEVESVTVSGGDLEKWLEKSQNMKRGPKPGQIARYQHEDLALLPDIERIMRDAGMSVTEAVRALSYKGRVKGRGTPESNIRRVVRLYNTSLPHLKTRCK